MDRVLLQIEEWKKRLIDLSKRNQLVYFDILRTSVLEIKYPECENVFEGLNNEEEFDIWLPPKRENEEEINPSDEQKQLFENEMIDPPKENEIVFKLNKRQDIEKRLKSIFRRASSDFQEKELRTSAIAMGLLCWKEKESGEEIHSPLLLFPVAISQATPEKPYKIEVSEEDVVLNPAIQVKLNWDFKIDLPLPEINSDSFDIEKYFQHIERLGKRDGWKVENRSFLGIYSFHKIAMYQDLAVNATSIAEHPVIKGLAAGYLSDRIVTDNIPERSDLDTKFDMARMLYILDADSSQSRAIETAIEGHSFVLKGPPGTGKSQTICNIIAEFLEAGKSVLFVSEKMAALEVVYNRLKEARLIDFCLELHSHKTNKKEVVKELMKCLEFRPIANKKISRVEFEKLSLLKKKLNEYVRELHLLREPIGKSMYDIFSQLAKLEEVPLIEIILPNKSSYSSSSLLHFEELVFKLKNNYLVIEQGDAFPWRGFYPAKLTQSLRSELLLLFESIKNKINELNNNYLEYTSNIGLEIPRSLSGCLWVINISELLLKNPIPVKCWINENIDPLLSEAEKYCELNKNYLLMKDSILKEFSADFISISEKIEIPFKSAWEKVSSLLPAEDSTGEKFINSYPDILEFVDKTLCFIEGCYRDVKEIQDILGINVPDGINLERAEQVAELATLISSDIKPIKQWLEPTVYYRAMEEHKRIKLPIIRYCKIANELSTKYDGNIYELDLPKMIFRFENHYISIFKYLRPSYYLDMKIIKKVNLTGKIPLSVIEDLKYAREANVLKESLAKKTSELKDLFGPYYDGISTNVETIELALEKALKITKLVGELPLPDKLESMACLSGIPHPSLGTIGKRLKYAIINWRNDSKSFQDYLSLNKLISSTLSATESPISSLEEYVRNLKGILSEFISQLNPIASTRDSRKIPSIAFIMNNFITAKNIRSYELQLKDESDKLKTKYGYKFIGIETNWENIISGLVWVREFTNLTNEVSLPDEFIENICKGNKPKEAELQELKQAFQNARISIDLLSSYFENHDYASLTTEQIMTNIEEMKVRINDLQIWFDYVEIIKEMKQKGLDGFISKLSELNLQSSLLLKVFHKAFYYSWADIICSEVPVIGEFRGPIHSSLIEEFKNLDKKLNLLSSSIIIEKLNESTPGLINIQGSEVSKIRSEAAKKAKHWPLRRLFNEIPNLLPKIKPCLLMSPLSVSHYLEIAKYNFDLVIFDEASQICSEDAVGAIARGKQLIVAGDNRQLPPTKFFQSELLNEEDYVEENVDNFGIYESVLDDCERIGLTPHPLLLEWHYRSKHESLIAYSNSRFYENRLITFPCAKEKSDDLGVKHIFVPDGIYDKGGKRNNVKEAEKVAELVIEHFTRYGDQKTLGVATLNLPQKDLVMDVLWQKRKERPDLAQFFLEDRLSGFFVKNLESVQGDERDVIILSLGYGKDAQGSFSMNFGPLNRDGGERRLNVIITRAKEKTIVVSSIKAGDFILSNIKSEGVRHLYQYLDYAERGVEALFGDINGGEVESPFEDEVKGEIMALGYKIVSQVGCSGYRIDLGVLDPSNPGNFMIGIECDGRVYHSAFTARERDRLRQNVLESLGWKIYRVWSTDWFRNRRYEVDKLKEVLKAASENKYFTSDIVVPQGVEIIYAKNREEEILDERVEYKCFKTKNRYPSYEFNTIGNYLLRRNTLKNIVKVEGPVHIDLAKRRLISIWGINRIGSIIEGTVANTIQNCIRERLIYKKGNFLWNSNSFKMKHIRIPTIDNPETIRDPEYVSVEEMQLAMMLITKKAVGIDQESLFSETARLFGWGRSGDRVEHVISSAFRKLLLAGDVIKEDNKVHLIRKKD